MTPPEGLGSVARLTSIHPTAIVHPKAELGSGISIGPYSVIHEDVAIGDGTQVSSHVCIEAGTQIGSDCQIYPMAVLGGVPQDLKYDGAPSRVVIGDRNTIREYVTVNRATEADGETVIGNDCLLMAYVHLAHNCVLGNGIVLANGVQLGGHVEVEDCAAVGGLTPVHQFVRIGRMAFVGGLSRVAKDVPPYFLAAGNPLKVAGINAVGLRRRGIPSEVRLELKRVYRLLYRSGFNVRQAVEAVRKELEPFPEVRHLAEFVENSGRGIS
ncbi:MAG: acyl-ACP--UDP-N-acetylglucosamine O-acyltransferase [Candidatus Eisenbacteria sp.]|nr:acyl-ACP--UDP-N-acetylglucosamine O-acyltransferase [Candidatus Eisenbacteria bacterium]